MNRTIVQNSFSCRRVAIVDFGQQGKEQPGLTLFCLAVHAVYKHTRPY